MLKRNNMSMMPDKYSFERNLILIFTTILYIGHSRLFLFLLFGFIEYSISLYMYLAGADKSIFIGSAIIHFFTLELTCWFWPERAIQMAELKNEIILMCKKHKAMIQINVMRTFINRLRDRSWKNIRVRGSNLEDANVLTRGKQTIICVENICIDTTVNLQPQIDEHFNNLKDLINKTEAKNLFLPGGGDIQLPSFFSQYCEENHVNIHLITPESLNNYINYN